MIYLHFVGENEKGIYKKIFSQKKSIEKNNKVKITFCKNEGYFLDDKRICFYSITNDIFSKIKRKFALQIVLLKLMKKKWYIDSKVVYIRYFGSSFIFIKYLKYLKRNNLKIVLEIPTYPYDKEVKKIKISVLEDYFYRKKLYKYVDRIVTFSEDKVIWNIPCINISNGINLDSNFYIKKNEKKSKKLVFTSVSNCSFWHGIDRFLYSLEQYIRLNNNQEILFNIVGDGQELKRITKIVKNSKYLNSIVKIHGVKLGKELDDIYRETNIGVGSLGRHRSGIYSLKSLKNREYCSKGLPIIFSENDLDFENMPFIYKASPDEILIDIEKVIRWYENLEILPNEIIKYSNKFSWDIQMRKVLDEIKNIK